MVIEITMPYFINYKKIFFPHFNIFEIEIHLINGNIYKSW